MSQTPIDVCHIVVHTGRKGRQMEMQNNGFIHKRKKNPKGELRADITDPVFKV